MKMIPHDAIQRTRSTLQPRQPVTRPSHPVEYAPCAQIVYLALITVSQSVAKLNEILIASLIALAVASRVPVGVLSGQLLPDPPDTESPEVLLDALQSSVAAVNCPAIRCRADQDCLRGAIGVR